MSHTQGTVRRGFEEVREVFDDIVADSRAGAAFAVVRRGETVVDLWGGLADPDSGRPWSSDTVCVLFSGTKGLTAAVATRASELDPDAPVRTYWPEFASDDVLVSHVLSHTAGLPYVDGDHDFLDVLAAERLLAKQEPLWTPGNKVAYHALTYGYLVDALVRHATGRSVADHLRADFARPHGLDLHLGTPPEVDPRVARLVRSPDYRISTFLQDEERRAIVNRMYGALLGSDEVINSAAYRRAELAAGSGVGSARAMATFYDLLAAGSLVPRSALDRATRTWAEGRDVINDRPVHFGLGFELPDPIGTYGPAEVAYGHSGAGGGRHGAWPEAEVGFSFLPAELRPEDTDDRANRLLDALHACLSRCP
ncbi:serine hydrolase domain-containing protein [Saccharomonospora azurea]